MANEFPASSRIWIYQSNRILNESESKKIEELATSFIHQWQVHGKPLKAKFELRKNLFLIFIVDETFNACSGCSIDSSVKLIKEIETEFQIDLMDRMCIAYKSTEGVQLEKMSDFMQLISNGKVTENTIVYNNLINTLSDLENNWEIPLSHSWHKQLLVTV